MKRLVTLAVVVLGFLVLARPAQAQWPTVQMYYGGTLKEAVFVTGADSAAFGDVFRVFNFAPPATAATMGERPFMNVACFYGPIDNPAVNGTKALKDLKPEMAWQHARFYPATADKPAGFFVTGLTKGGQGMRGLSPPASPQSYYLSSQPPAAALDVLKRLGVPIGPAR